MSTYAIGDVQGCWDALQALLRRIAYRPGQDRLLLAGDLVSRGPDSLAVLRWARAAGDGVQAVLGNHDLHLLACAAGLTSPQPGSQLGPVLAAADAKALVGWLRARPLALAVDGHLVVHAGLLPSWSAADALALATEAGAALGGGDDALARTLSRPPAAAWEAPLAGPTRLPCVVAALTVLRVCTAAGQPELGFCGPPEAAPPGTAAWFTVPGRRSAATPIVFGHWSALGLHTADNVRALDTGAVWGGALTAFRLDDGALFSVPTRAAAGA